MKTNTQYLKGKTILLIGSGADIDGRHMGDAIDSPNRAGYDLIARVNKAYGSQSDCGARADIIFVRKRHWFPCFWGRIRESLQSAYDNEKLCIISFAEGMNCPISYADDAAQELGLPKASTGLLAAKWLVEQGAAVTVIGYGYSDGHFAAEKTYAVNGITDTNPNYEWAAENEWLRCHVTLI